MGQCPAPYHGIRLRFIFGAFVEFLPGIVDVVDRGYVADREEVSCCDGR